MVQVNMDGTALFVTVASIFIAQVNSILNILMLIFFKYLKMLLEILEI